MARIPKLMAISDRQRLPAGVGLEDWLRELGRAGVDGVQIREKDLADRPVLELAIAARRRLPPPAVVLVNGRLDIALAAAADGVHLPTSGVPLQPLRRRFGPRPLIGRSTHRPQEVEAAARDGADYVTFGPVYPTPGKERYGPPPGLGGLRRAVVFGLPVLALGGITEERLAEVAAAGAAGAAAIRMFLDTALLPRLVERTRECFG